MIRITHFRSQMAAAVLAGSLALAAAPAAMANETFALKNALYGAGYDINNVSTQMDDATRSALEKFQRDKGLTASGMLDDATKKALGMVSVQVAASSSSNNNSGSSQNASASNTVSQPEPEAEVKEVEEEDDGGWSLW